MSNEAAVRVPTAAWLNEGLLSEFVAEVRTVAGVQHKGHSGARANEAAGAKPAASKAEANSLPTR
jgi:hypothetical protein